MSTLPADLAVATSTVAARDEGSARLGGRGPSIHDVVGGRRQHDGADHWARLGEDLDLLAWLGVDAHHLTISWSRVQPNGRGAINGTGLDGYDRLVDGLLERGIQPIVTLQHDDLPAELQDAPPGHHGGWNDRDLVGRLADLAVVVGRRLGDRVSRWATLHDPWTTAVRGHFLGERAPGVRSAEVSIRAGHHLLLAHGTCVQALRSEGATNIGIDLGTGAVVPRSDREGDHEAARRFDAIRFRWWRDAVLHGRLPDDLGELLSGEVEEHLWMRDDDLATIGQPIDWLGISIADAAVVGAGPASSRPGPGLAGVTIVERSADASGALGAARGAVGELPVWVRLGEHAGDDRLDSGAVERLRVDDGERIDALDADLDAVLAARASGLVVHGVTVAPLLDGHRWGSDERTGLVHVAREGFSRTTKRSAHEIRERCAERG